jgi:hypothetical protein
VRAPRLSCPAAWQRHARARAPTPAGDPARYFLQPRSKILEELTDRERTCTAELERLKGSRAALEKGAGAAEGELRELLQSSPALARALSKQ